MPDAIQHIYLTYIIKCIYYLMINLNGSIILTVQLNVKNTCKTFITHGGWIVKIIILHLFHYIIRDFNGRFVQINPSIYLAFTKVTLRIYETQLKI